MTETIGLVYILSNPALKGMLIIGFTVKEGLETKITQLSRSTGVSLPFEEVLSLLVTYPEQYRFEFQVRFHKNRVSQDKELFEIDARMAIRAILRMLRYSEDYQKAKLANVMEATILADEDKFREFLDKEYSLADQIAVAKDILDAV